MAMAEYAEVTDKLSELRSQKQKLSRQVCINLYSVLKLLFPVTKCTFVL